MLRPGSGCREAAMASSLEREGGSARLAAVQPPIIPVIGELIRRHPGTISLGQGIVWYGPPAEALGRIPLFLAEPGNHKYQAVRGIPELLERIEEKLVDENGIILGDGRRVVVTAGANMAFLNALLAIADPGDEIILNLPFYFNHEMAIRMANCQPVLVPTDAQYQLQPDRIAAAITSRTRAIVTVSPNNPTGVVYPEAILREINQLCRERGIYHIHDEAYEYFVHGKARHFSPGAIEGSAGYTILLYSLSKAYGFASWRIGYQVIPAHLTEAVEKIQDTNLICPPVISQHVAVGALTVGASYCREKLAELTKVRTQAMERLRELGAVCPFPESEGAFYFFLRVETERTPLEVVTELVRDHRVAVIPGSAFGVTTGCPLRVSYGALQPETVVEGIDRLVHGLKVILNRG
jgi:aspartate/methionine/tyrosine aminotransferase